MKNKLTFLTLFITLMMVPAIAHAQASVESLLKKHTEALGGEENIRNVSSLSQTGKITYTSQFTGTLEGPLNIILVPRKKVYKQSELGPYKTTTVWNGTEAWEIGPQGFRMLEGGELSSLMEQSQVFFTTGIWKADDTVIEPLGDTEIDEKPHYGLKFSGPNTTDVEVYFNKDTHLISQIKTTIEIPNVGVTPIVTDIWEYKTVENIKIASKISVNVEGLFTSETHFTDLIVNAEIDEKVFTKPTQ